MSAPTETLEKNVFSICGPTDLTRDYVTEGGLRKGDGEDMRLQ